ncbi:hypothetical protein M758_8G008900 [Ceratodon purpureus]|nr:hypothetical protein M758_8G008900 [Ceratodon purpureus]
MRSKNSNICASFAGLKTPLMPLLRLLVTLSSQKPNSGMMSMACCYFVLLPPNSYCHPPLLMLCIAAHQTNFHSYKFLVFSLVVAGHGGTLECRRLWQVGGHATNVFHRRLVFLKRVNPEIVNVSLLHATCRDF